MPPVRTDFATSIFLSRLLAGQGREEEATALLNQARAHAPDTAVAHTTLGQGYPGARGALHAEARVPPRAARLDQEYLPARFHLGSVLRRKGELQEARQNLERVAMRDAGYPGLPLERGLVYESADDPAQAVVMYTTALRSAPNDVELKLRVGATSVMTGDMDGAKRYLDEVLQLRPNSAEAHYYLGRIAFSRADYVAASALLHRSVDLDSSVATYHLYFGWVSDLTGNLARAHDELDQALVLDDRLAEAYWRRGLLRLRSNAPRDAKADLDKALELDPSLYSAYAALGDVLDRLRDLPGAIRAYREAIAHAAGVGQWHYRLGMLLLDVGDAGGAVAALQQSTVLGSLEDPRPGWLADSYRNLGTALQQSGQRATAITALRKFLELAPADSIDRPEVERELNDLTTP